LDDTKFLFSVIGKNIVNLDLKTKARNVFQRGKNPKIFSKMETLKIIVNLKEYGKCN
jgi:hypothetical protein